MGNESHLDVAVVSESSEFVKGVNVVDRDSLDSQSPDSLGLCERREVTDDLASRNMNEVQLTLGL